jgi:hypothetical protein
MFVAAIASCRLQGSKVVEPYIPYPGQPPLFSDMNERGVDVLELKFKSTFTAQPLSWFIGMGSSITVLYSRINGNLNYQEQYPCQVEGNTLSPGADLDIRNDMS